MSNLITQYYRGKEGKNIGLPTGISSLDRAINGIQKGQIIAIAAAEKVGKSAICNFAFVIMPYLLGVLIKGLKVRWIYYSFEIDRISMEFNFAAFFMAYDYQILDFEYRGNRYKMSGSYLQGKMLDKDDNPIMVSQEHEDKLRLIYRNRIVPMLGEYNEHGIKISQGVIEFVGEATNPTGIRNHLLHFADNNGRWITEPYMGKDEQGKEVEKYRRVGYTPNNPDEFIIVVLDHIRKMKSERGYNRKDNIDKVLEYQVELRNNCKYTFIDIVHLNRAISSIERLKFNPEFLHPTSDDLKDSGNVGEEANILLTMFDPNDEKYSLKKHFGLDLFEGRTLKYPNYKSLHLVSSRDTQSHQHMQLNMYGNIGAFEQLIP